MDSSQNPRIGTRRVLTSELKKLEESILSLGEITDEIFSIATNLNNTSKSFENILEKNLVEKKKQAKILCEEIEENIFLVLSLQQPLVKDLRFVLGTLRITGYFAYIINFLDFKSYSLDEINNKNNIINSDYFVLFENFQSMLKDCLNAIKLKSYSLAMKILEKKDENIILLKNFANKISKNILESKDPEILINSLNSLDNLKILEKLSECIFLIAKEIYFINSGKKL